MYEPSVRAKCPIKCPNRWPKTSKFCSGGHPLTMRTSKRYSGIRENEEGDDPHWEKKRRNEKEADLSSWEVGENGG